MRDAGVLVACAGVSAAVFGVLYGSVFGSDEIIRPLWMSPLKRVFEEPGGGALWTFFATAVCIGFVIMNVGLVVNIVNRCLLKNPDDRYINVAEIIEILQPLYQKVSPGGSIYHCRRR